MIQNLLTSEQVEALHVANSALQSYAIVVTVLKYHMQTYSGRGVRRKLVPYIYNLESRRWWSNSHSGNLREPRNLPEKNFQAVDMHTRLSVNDDLKDFLKKGDS
jgi:hypothetical protein